MFIPFLKAFGLILLYMLALAAIVWPLTLWVADDLGSILILVLGTTVVAIAGFVPFLNGVIKRAFRFAGQGEPVPEPELRSALLSVNQFDVPVMVEERKGKLVATWKYVDARWWELLAKAGLIKSYELHIKLDAAHHRATLIDVTRSVSWGAGPTDVRLRGGFFRGVVSSYEIGKQWGIKENFELGTIYDYRFEPQEIKTSFMNTILQRGWDVRFGMW
jgi:hypothetical protein